MRADGASGLRAEPRIREHGPVNTTLDILDPLVRKAKSETAKRGQTLKEFVAEALLGKLSTSSAKARPGEPEWMQGFGKLRRLRRETARGRRSRRPMSQSEERGDCTPGRTSRSSR